MAKRKMRYGNFRQIYIDCAGMCIGCHWIDGLEFHHINPDLIVLLCRHCHDIEQDVDMSFYFHANRNNLVPSRLAEDIDWEIEAYGYQLWLAKFNLDDSRTGRLLNARELCTRIPENSRGVGSIPI